MRIDETRRAWDAASLEECLHRVDATELADPAMRLEWLDALATWGAALIEGVAPTLLGLRAVAAQVGVVQATNYGVDWEIVASAQPLTPVDSDQPLRVHTDLPYRERPPGVQFLLAAVADAPGGETLLVDGLTLAARIADEDPEAFAVLTERERTFAYVADGQRYIGGGPVIGLDRLGGLDLIRHAPDLVLPVRNSDGDAASAEAALRALERVAERPSLAFRLRLSPGQMLCFDNHRVLHGRGAVDLGAGGRHLLGCYLAHDELDSARRVLRHTAKGHAAKGHAAKGHGGRDDDLES